MAIQLILPFTPGPDRGQVRERLLRRYRVDLTDLVLLFFEHYQLIKEHSPIELVDRLSIPKDLYVGLSFKESAEFEYLLAIAFDRLYLEFERYLEPLFTQAVLMTFKRFVGNDLLVRCDDETPD